MIASSPQQEVFPGALKSIHNSERCYRASSSNANELSLEVNAHSLLLAPLILGPVGISKSVQDGSSADRALHFHAADEPYLTMLIKQIRRSLVLVGLVITIFVYTVIFASPSGQSLSIGALAKLRAVEIANRQFLEVTSAIGPKSKQKPVIFEEDKNSKLFIHADEQNDFEFFAHVSPKLAKANKIGGNVKETTITNPSITHHEVFSEGSKNRELLPIFMGGRQIYNPNVIPHPRKSDLWIVIAQHRQSGDQGVAAQQLSCAATFLDDVLTCTDEPTLLSVEPSIPGQCEGKYANYNMQPGARDARIFYGPDVPMITYGSQSSYACLGVWLQDARSVVDVFAKGSAPARAFRAATEIQRPLPTKRFEKNFFLFWDENNKPYVHHDIYPHRVFAELKPDGSVGPNLATAAVLRDTVCADQYMPTVKGREEFIHQATNSLLITTCRRSDYDCRPHNGNTFIMTIFQHKTYHESHSVYEPYVMLFQNHLPFAIHAIGRKPLWIHGRGAQAKDFHSANAMQSNTEIPSVPVHESTHHTPPNQSEMFYVTSMSWKAHGQRYHGYIDDTVLLAFGIEDSMAAVIDIKAEDLVQNLGHCSG